MANSSAEADGTPAGETAFEAEQKHQELEQQEGAQQPSADAAAGLQATCFGVNQDIDDVDHQTAEQQPTSTGVHGDDPGLEQEAGLPRTSSEGSRQSYRRKGRPKCIVM